MVEMYFIIYSTLLEFALFLKIAYQNITNCYFELAEAARVGTIRDRQMFGHFIVRVEVVVKLFSVYGINAKAK